MSNSAVLQAYLLRVCFLLGLCFLPPVLAEDWLSSDEEFSFSPPLSAPARAPRASRTRFSQFATQGDGLQRWRSELSFEFERALKLGHYIRLDMKSRRFHASDELAEAAGGAYHENEVEELWWQWSGDSCFAKVGRQGVYWGAVDNSFALDQLTPFDYTEALLTSFTALRAGQDAINLRCYQNSWQVEVFVNPRPDLSTITHQSGEDWEALEDSLHEEWAVRLQWAEAGRDIALIWARVEDNLPTPVFNAQTTDFDLAVARYDLLGLSLVQAIERLLVQVDVAWHSDQLQAYTSQTQHEWQVALGLEYTTSGNHRFNAGVWHYIAPPLNPGDNGEPTALWSFSWGKGYFNDELDLSILGQWGGDPRQGMMTGLADYVWTQHWSTRLALSYSNADETAGGLVNSIKREWSLSTELEWVY